MLLGASVKVSRRLINLSQALKQPPLHPLPHHLSLSPSPPSLIHPQRGPSPLDQLNGIIPQLVLRSGGHVTLQPPPTLYTTAFTHTRTLTNWANTHWWHQIMREENMNKERPSDALTHTHRNHPTGSCSRLKDRYTQTLCITQTIKPSL